MKGFNEKLSTKLSSNYIFFLTRRKNINLQYYKTKINKFPHWRSEFVCQFCFLNILNKIITLPLVCNPRNNTHFIIRCNGFHFMYNTFKIWQYSFKNTDHVFLYHHQFIQYFSFNRGSGIKQWNNYKMEK